MCGRTATVLTLMASGYARVPTKAGYERPGWESTCLPRVRMCEIVCAYAALFIRAVNQGRYDITLCETKRGKRTCRADMFRYVALGDRNNVKANAKVTQLASDFRPMCDPIFERYSWTRTCDNTKNSFIQKNISLITGLFSVDTKEHKRNYFVEISKNLSKQRFENKFVGLSK